MKHNDSLLGLTTNDADFTRKRYEWQRVDASDDNWQGVATIEKDLPRLIFVIRNHGFPCQ